MEADRKNPPAPPDRRVRAHLVTSGILGAAVLGLVLIWAYPMVLLWLLLGAVGVMAYAAIFLLVSARLAEEDEDDEPESASEDEAEDSPDDDS